MKTTGSSYGVIEGSRFLIPIRAWRSEPRDGLGWRGSGLLKCLPKGVYALLHSHRRPVNIRAHRAGDSLSQPLESSDYRHSGVWSENCCSVNTSTELREEGVWQCIRW